MPGKKLPDQFSGKPFFVVVCTNKTVNKIVFWRILVGKIRVM